ncbi:MAG: FliM/FliN family flagellar motor switch protein [Planctomycetota bacterium]|nr:MAG: FliM/FliN family flagellar motor switch protein [Planctomycetota bacterium]
MVEHKGEHAMSTHVSDEERDALLEQTGAAGAGPSAGPTEVAQRDFSQPRRVAAAEMDAIANEIDRRLPRIQQAARQLLGSDVLVKLASATESSADRLVESWKPPFALLAFRSRGQVCWVSMDCAKAVAEFELLLGATPHETARALSSAEQRLLVVLTRLLFAPLCDLLDFEFENLRAVDEPCAIGTWRHGEGAPDPHRLTIELEIERPTSRYSIRAHVPPPARRAASSAGAATPPVEHIRDLDLEISARLGALEMPLSELLALETGDVLPLGASADAGLDLYVNGRAWAVADLGARGEKLAVALRNVVEGTPKE